MSQPYPNPGGYGPQAGYGPQGGHFHPPPQQPQRPGAVELKVSYALPIALLLLLGLALLAGATYSAVDTFTAEPDEPVGFACTDELTGANPTCKDTATRRMTWSVPLAAKYRVELHAVAPHAVSIDKGTTRVGTMPGKAGKAALLVELDPGDYTVRVDDPPTAAADRSYTLAVRWLGPKGTRLTAPEDKRDLKPEFWALLVAGLVCFGIAPMLLLLKRSVPLRLDANGLTLRNGRTLPWSELQGIQFVNLRIQGTIRESSAELTFRSGRAQILFRRVKNMHEVRPILAMIAQGQNPWA